MTGSKHSLRSERLSLSLKEWLVAVVICLVVMKVIPVFWQRCVWAELEPDLRMSYTLSHDYWLFEQLCHQACDQYERVLIGDSVVWGHYVPRDRTLSHFLNEQLGTQTVANLGLEGAHPLALEGLLRYHGTAIRNKMVILHFNPLWMSSPKHDLQTSKEFHFNHPDLVPQFRSTIPCYQASWETRLSRIIQQHVDFFAWMSHVNLTYYNGLSLPAWTIEHPKDCPLRLEAASVPGDDNYERSSGLSRTFASLTLDWVSVESSLQWCAFTRTIQWLNERGNRTLVLVGPFNEYLLSSPNLARYNRLKQEIEAWLSRNDIEHLILEPLPAEYYQDTSHPTAQGYAMLAKQITEHDFLIDP